MAETGHRTRDRGAKAPGRRRCSRDGDGLRHALCPGRRRSRRRHHPCRRLRRRQRARAGGHARRSASREMAHHVAAVARARPRALVVADLPWMSYHVDAADTLRNAAVLVRAGAEAVKLEGGRRRLPVVHAMLDAEIPVMGHLGLTPQSVHAMGGYGCRRATAEAARGARARREGARRRGVLRDRARGRARRSWPSASREVVDIPTIGIGAGPACDGQVLVLHDLLGLSSATVAKFVRRYADLARRGPRGGRGVRRGRALAARSPPMPRRTTPRRSCATALDQPR